MTDIRHHDDHNYRVPIDLSIIPTQLKRVLVIGSCLAAGLPDYIRAIMPECSVDYVLFNNLSELPESPPNPPISYDFQIVQIALRSVLPDHLYFRLPDCAEENWASVFNEARQRLVQLLQGALRWNSTYGLLTFISNFMVPQQNPHGRLLPRYDLSNPIFFVERLNQCLSEELNAFGNSYILDFDQIASTFGRKYIQDDGVWQFNHGAVLGDRDAEFDQDRILPVPAVSQIYTSHAHQFIQAICSEIIALFRTIRLSDSVKMVVVDLDDILWRGIAAERDDSPPEAIEGWPLGIVEALGFLRRRGILLSIVSKNEESKVAGFWDKIFRGRLSLNDFAVYRINWKSKVENIEAVIREVNLLPRNVIFIDDNPVERASIKAAFPDIRVIGSNQYLLRRILLWAPETQVPVVTAESTRRTEMIQANAVRHAERTRLSRHEFLSTLDLRVMLTEVADIQQKSFQRVLELINKTNQFNTSGRRWTMEECRMAFDTGVVFYVFEVEDRFSQYGLVGVVIASSNRIEQIVMSCRVVGLDVEIAVMAEVVRRMTAEAKPGLVAYLIKTESNSLCQNFLERCGFSPMETGWWKSPEKAISMPDYVKIGWR